MFILDQRLATTPQHHWVSKLVGFDFAVEYKPGRVNTVVDALSRHDAEMAALHAVSSPTFELLEDFRRAVATNTELAQLRQEIQNGVLGDQWALPMAW